MGMRLGSAHGLGAHTWRSLIAALAVAVIVTLGATSATTASPDCRVQNTDTGKTYAALQVAVDAASTGDHLTVAGTCHGTTVIDKNLLIEGKRTRSGTPTLDGDGKLRPLTIMGSRPGRVRVTRAPRVTIRDLTIRDGRASPPIHVPEYGGAVGGGIWNDGTLKLLDVVVRDNRGAIRGGGIFNATHATLRLNGRTRIIGNKATYSGGGIECWYCTVILNDSSTIEGNTARPRYGDGGGVFIYHGQLTLNGSSAIRGNTARSHGGGVFYFEAGIVLNDTSSIRDNRAGASGGGIFDTGPYDYDFPGGGGITLNDASSITGNRAAASDSCCERRCGGTRSLGGGVWVAFATTFTMTGASVISGNHAACGAGGLYSEIGPDSSGSLVGVSCAPQTLANVYGNTPDDCYIEP